jgi:hypothetical protein
VKLAASTDVIRLLTGVCTSAGLIVTCTEIISFFN